MGLFLNVATQFLQGAQPKRPQPGLLDFLIATSKAMDLLEGRPMRSGLRVAVIAGTIARKLSLSQREVNAVVYAGLVHDIGLAAIAADLYPVLPRGGATEKELFFHHPLLNARAVSNPYESGQYEQQLRILSAHPQAAGRLIERLFLSEDVREIVAHHHELFDGSGYPFGLSGEAIPLGARILAFADTIECVMGEVSGLTTRKIALDGFLEIKVAGKFDPAVVDAFQAVTQAEGPDFLRKIVSLEVEAMVRQLAQEREQPLTAVMVLEIARAMATLPESLLPLYTQGRSENLARYAVKMAEKLGIHREQCGELLLAAMLQDLGKLAIPIGVLLRQGTLTEEHWSIIHDYPRFTEEILKGIPGFENITLWASEHHERMNGRGYPGRKKGFEISVGGRILAIADVFDALTSPRPYRNHAYDALDALPVMGQGRFSLYDNQLISLLRQVILETDVVAERQLVR